MERGSQDCQSVISTLWCAGRQRQEQPGLLSGICSSELTRDLVLNKANSESQHPYACFGVCEHAHACTCDIHIQGQNKQLCIDKAKLKTKIHHFNYQVGMWYILYICDIYYMCVCIYTLYVHIYTMYIHCIYTLYVQIVYIHIYIFLRHCQCWDILSHGKQAMTLFLKVVLHSSRQTGVSYCLQVVSCILKAPANSPDLTA